MNEEKLYYSDAENENRYRASENNDLNLFFAAVAHELKSPVNSLIMLVDLLRNEAGIDQNRQACTLGYTGAGRCAYEDCKTISGARVLQTGELDQSRSDDDIAVLYCRDCRDCCGRFLKEVKAQQRTVAVEGDVCVYGRALDIFLVTEIKLLGESYPCLYLDWSKTLVTAAHAGKERTHIFLLRGDTAWLTGTA